MKVIATKTLPIDVVRIDGGTQNRDLDLDWVESIARDIEYGDEIKNPVVFFDGKEYWLADGFHRYHATRNVKKVSLICDVINGTLDDAIYYSWNANIKHGLPPTLEVKRSNAVKMLKHPKYGARSDLEIAKHCGLSHPTVARLRAENAPETKDKPRIQVDKHGNETTKKLPKPVVKEPPPPPAPDERDIEIARLTDQIDALITEVDDLTLQLAVGSSDDPDFTKNMIEELRAEVKQLQIENASLVISRDQFQAENAQLIKQVNFLTKKLKQVSPA